MLTSKTWRLDEGGRRSTAYPKQRDHSLAWGIMVQGERLGARGKVGAKHPATQTAPILSRRDLGASLRCNNRSAHRSAANPE